MSFKETWWILQMIMWTIAVVTIILLFTCMYKKAMEVQWQMCECCEICDLEGVTGHGDWYE